MIAESNDSTYRLAVQERSPPIRASDGMINPSVSDFAHRDRIVGVSGKLATSNAVAITTITTTTIVPAPGVGRALRIYYIHANNNATTVDLVTWRAGTTGPEYFAASLARGGSLYREFNVAYWQLPENTLLALTTSAAGGINYQVLYEVVNLRG